MSKSAMIVGFSLAMLTAAAGVYWDSTLLPEQRKQRDIEETLKNNPSAYVAADGQIKYGNQADIRNNFSVKNEQASVEKDISKSASTLKKHPKTRDMPNLKIMAKLEEGLARELANKGFPANEAEIIFKEIKAGIESGENNSLSISKDKLTKNLSLSPERRNAMDLAISLAMDDTGGSYSVDEWETCFNKRVQKSKTNECEESLIADFKDAIRANSENDRINSATRNKISSIETDFFNKSEDKCKTDRLTAAKLFSVLLSNCD